MENFNADMKKTVLSILGSYGFPSEKIFFEEQDDGGSLSIYIPLDDFKGDDSVMSLRAYSITVGSVLPFREDCYTWFTFFTRSGRIVQSFFGGDSSSPNSGF